MLFEYFITGGWCSDHIYCFAALVGHSSFDPNKPFVPIDHPDGPPNPRKASFLPLQYVIHVAKEGACAFCYGYYKNQMKIIKILLQAGADPTLRTDSTNISAIHMMWNEVHNQEDFYRYIIAEEVLQLMKEMVDGRAVAAVNEGARGKAEIRSRILAKITGRSS